MGWMRWFQRLLGGRADEVRPELPETAPTLSPVPRPVLEPVPEFPRGAFHPGLFAALRVDPDDASRYAVLADWLIEQDDPRGRLILDMQDGTLPTEHLERHALELYGPLRAARREHVGPTEELRRAHLHRWRRDAPFASVVAGWRHGFVDRLWVRPRARHDWDEEPDPPNAAVRAFLEHPSCWVLRELTLGGSHLDPAVLGGPYPTVRRLRVGDFLAGEECEMSWSEQGDWSAVRDRFPSATDVTAQGGFEALDLPDGVRSFTLEASVVAGSVIRTLLARAGSMRRLELWTGTADYGGDVALDDLGGLRDLNLDHLGLRNSELTDAFVGWLVETPLAARLRVLDLSLGTLSDEGAAILARNRDAFPRLERLDIHDNAVMDQLEPLRAAYGDALVAGEQGGAYVSVAE